MQHLNMDDSYFFWIISKRMGDPKRVQGFEDSRIRGFEDSRIRGFQNFSFIFIHLKGSKNNDSVRFCI